MTSDEESDTDGVRILLSSDDNSEPDDLSVVPLDPSVPPTFLQITNNPEILIQRHRDEPRMIGSDGMPRPWMSILARHYMWIRMNEWFEAKRLDRNIPLVKFTKDKTMEVTCAYVNPQNTNEIQILKGFSEIGKTFLKHVYGRKGRDPNLDEVRREPDKPYQPFQIFKIVSVQDVINDPRGVTKIVTADRDINAGEVIGMYDGKYLLQVEHHEIEETNVLNAFEREYKLHEFESTTNTSHHISTAILNHEKLNLSNIARERGQVKSLLLMDGAACRGMYGWASEINDYRKNPFGEDEPPNENCRILEVTVCGWPIFFLTITKPILKGQEVLLDYSSSYWPFIRKLYNDEQTVTALLDPLERCLPKLHASLPDMIQTYTPLLATLTSCNTLLHTHFESRNLDPPALKEVQTLLNAIRDTYRRIDDFISSMERIVVDIEETRRAREEERYQWGCRRRGVLAPARIVATYFQKRGNWFQCWVKHIEAVCRRVEGLIGPKTGEVGRRNVVGMGVSTFREAVKTAEVEGAKRDGKEMDGDGKGKGKRKRIKKIVSLERVDNSEEEVVVDVIGLDKTKSTVSPKPASTLPSIEALPLIRPPLLVKLPVPSKKPDGWKKLVNSTSLLISGTFATEVLLGKQAKIPLPSKPRLPHPSIPIPRPPSIPTEFLLNPFPDDDEPVSDIDPDSSPLSVKLQPGTIEPSGMTESMSVEFLGSSTVPSEATETERQDGMSEAGESDFSDIYDENGRLIPGNAPFECLETEYSDDNLIQEEEEVLEEGATVSPVGAVNATVSKSPDTLKRAVFSRNGIVSSASQPNDEKPAKRFCEVRLELPSPVSKRPAGKELHTIAKKAKVETKPTTNESIQPTLLTQELLSPRGTKVVRNFSPKTTESPPRPSSSSVTSATVPLSLVDFTFKTTKKARISFEDFPKTLSDTPSASISTVSRISSTSVTDSPKSQNISHSFHSLPGKEPVTVSVTPINKGKSKMEFRDIPKNGSVSVAPGLISKLGSPKTIVATNNVRRMPSKDLPTTTLAASSPSKAPSSKEPYSKEPSLEQKRRNYISRIEVPKPTPPPPSPASRPPPVKPKWDMDDIADIAGMINAPLDLKFPEPKLRELNVQDVSKKEPFWTEPSLGETMSPCPQVPKASFVEKETLPTPAPEGQETSAAGDSNYATTEDMTTSPSKVAELPAIIKGDYCFPNNLNSDQKAALMTTVRKLLESELSGGDYTQLSLNIRINEEAALLQPPSERFIIELIQYLGEKEDVELIMEMCVAKGLSSIEEAIGKHEPNVTAAEPGAIQRISDSSLINHEVSETVLSLQSDHDVIKVLGDSVDTNTNGSSSKATDSEIDRQSRSPHLVKHPFDSPMSPGATSVDDTVFELKAVPQSAGPSHVSVRSSDDTEVLTGNAVTRNDSMTSSLLLNANGDRTTTSGSLLGEPKNLPQNGSQEQVSSGPIEVIDLDDDDVRITLAKLARRNRKPLPKVSQKRRERRRQPNQDSTVIEIIESDDDMDDEIQIVSQSGPSNIPHRRRRTEVVNLISDED